jgi:hypothetical protein
MTNKFEGGGFDPSREKVKSSEELRFEELVADARNRSLEGNYAFAETEEDEKAVNQESMRGAYLESGDPEKMAMYRLQEAKINLGSLAMSLDTLANWDERQKEKGVLERAAVFAKGWKKGWEKGRSERVAELEPILSELGLPAPQTAEEARALKSQIVSSENLQKLAAKYKAELK